MPPSTSESEKPNADDPQMLVARAKELLGRSRLDFLPEALSLTIRAIELLSSRPLDDSATRKSLAVAMLTRADVLRETGIPEARADALPIFREAIAHLEAVLDQSQPADTNELGSAWMHLGMCLLDEGTAQPLEEALHCFDRAIDLRKGLPLDQEPLYRWGLAAGWMNRADVLTRLGGEERLAGALSSYDEAIVQLEQLPATVHPSRLSRHALAWMNRGLTLRGFETPDTLAQALQSFENGIKLLTAGGSPADREQQRILACTCMNRSNALLAVTPERPQEAREDASTAMSLIAPFEQSELMSAQMGLQARHLLCRATAYLADAGVASTSWIEETTDAVDEGMALTRHWTHLGEDRLVPLGCELFHYGCLIYRIFQPHFLTEFLVESLDPEVSPGAPAGVSQMHHIATDALWGAAANLRNRQGDAPETTLELIEDFQQTELRLTALRQKYLAVPPAS